jgi:hypothetical protein
MKTVLVNEYAKICTEEKVPVILWVFRKLPALSNAMKELCDSFLEFVEKSPRADGLVYSICDCKYLSPYSFDLFVNFYIALLPKLTDKGVALTAFVCPKDFGKSIDYLEFIRRLDNRPIACFQEYYQARQFVMDEWNWDKWNTAQYSKQ